MAKNKREIENGLIYHGDKLTSFESGVDFGNPVVIRKGTKKIEECVFKDSCVERVVFPEDLEIVCGSAFKDCRYLKEVNITNPVELGAYAFSDIHNLEKIILNCKYIIHDSFCGAGIHSKNGVDVKLINTNSIGINAFYGACINSLELPDTLKEIKPHAFLYTEFNFNSLKLPEGLVALDEMAFDGCEGLKHIFLPDNLLFLGTLDENITYHTSKKTYDKFGILQDVPNVIVDVGLTMDEMLNSMTFKEYNNRQLDLDNANNIKEDKNIKF